MGYKQILSIFILGALILMATEACKKDTVPDEEDGLPMADHHKLLGSSAGDLLSSDAYGTLNIEFICASGFEPSAGVRADFRNFLEARLNKSSIQISSKVEAALSKESVSTADLKNIESAHRTQYIKGSSMAICILITDGAYVENDVLGLAYYNTSCALMGGRIRDLSGGLAQPSEDLVVQSVLRHEIGHLLGLVDLGSPMQTNHKDATNGSHCDDEQCLMYYAIESGDFIGNLIGMNAPPPLDSRCLADLKANGGK